MVHVEFKEAIIPVPSSSGDGNNATSNNNGHGEPEIVNVDEEEGVGVAEDKESAQGDFPPVQLDLVEAMMLKFYQDVLRKYIDLKAFGMEEGFEVENTPRELVKLVSDVVWSGLARSYNSDAPHIQSLYTYLSGKFGNDDVFRDE